MGEGEGERQERVNDDKQNTFLCNRRHSVVIQRLFSQDVLLVNLECLSKKFDEWCRRGVSFYRLRVAGEVSKINTHSPQSDAFCDTFP